MKKQFAVFGGFLLFLGVLLTVILLPTTLDALWQMDWRDQASLEDYVHEDLRIGFEQGGSPRVLARGEEDRIELWALERRWLFLNRVERRIDFPYTSDWNEPSEEWEEQNAVSPLTRWSAAPPEAGRFEGVNGRVFFVPEQDGPVRIQAVYADRLSNRLDLFVKSPQTPLWREALWSLRVNAVKIGLFLAAVLLFLPLILFFRWGRKRATPSAFHVALAGGGRSFPVSLEVGERLLIQAFNCFVGGQRVNVSDAVRWSVDPPECGRVFFWGDRAVFEAFSPGPAVITSDYLGRSGETIHLVIEPPAGRTFSSEEPSNEEGKSVQEL